MAAWLLRITATAFLCAFVPPAWGHAPDEEVIALHTAALAENPNDVARLVGRGDLWLRAGHFEAAERDFRRALALDPNGPATVLGWAEWNLLSGRTVAAVEILDRFLNDHPEVTGGWRLRAQAQRVLGDVSGEAISWDRVLALEPQPADFLARSHLALAHETRAVALDVLERGIAKSGAASLRWRVIELASPADLDRALRQLAALESEMDCPAVVAAKRGDLLHASGRNVEAFAEWTRALESLERTQASRRTPARDALARQLRTSLSEGMHP